MARLAAFLLALTGGVSAALAQQAPLECNSCHETSRELLKSVHGSLSCDSCHDQVTAYPHPAKMPKPACVSCHETQAREQMNSIHGQELKKGNGAAPECTSCHGGSHEIQKATTEAFRKAVPGACGACHSDVEARYKAGVHGAAAANGVKDAPVCTDCHGEHSILPKNQAASPVNRSNIRETCGRCHGDVRLASRFGLPPDRLTTFDFSYHGLAARGGTQAVANCASCHGFHDILPSSDPKSMTNAKNLPQTCGKCHPGAGTRFAIGAIHWLEGNKEPGFVRWVRLFYIGVIPLTIGLMILHHGGDWIRKLIRLRFRPGSHARPGRGLSGREVAHEVRMYPFERVQHALLAISFLVLAWTGFALKYPNSAWSAPLLAWESSWPVRGTVHRIAAVIFIACGVIHVVSLIVSRKLREHWFTLLPKARDIREGMGQLAYNLALTGKKPQVSAHSYVEKVEYWAVVWGALVMGLSGILLWFNNWSLAWLPKVWLDAATAIHLYEAILACLAILVWHLYSVIFDPDVYPLDTAFLNGKSPRHRREAAPPADAALIQPQSVNKQAGEDSSQL
ncbi:MAG: cytochrome b/b6 domain-containing protein [Bryobacterales bacterium]|nr:cytochrome b/b6 domain-containing protein [Bryobacterales bacterium]